MTETVDVQKDKVAKLELDKFQDFVIIKDCISVVGSSVDKQDKEPGDLDMVVRLDPKYDYIKRAINNKLTKLDSRVETIWEPSGSSDDYVPLYDLVLRRVNPDKVLVEMKEGQSEDCEPLKSFKTMKPGKRFYDIDSVLNYIFG